MAKLFQRFFALKALGLSFFNLILIIKDESAQNIKWLEIKYFIFVQNSLIDFYCAKLNSNHTKLTPITLINT
jgi:hypothetical protein